MNLYQQTGSSNLIGWKLEVGVASYFIQHDKGLHTEKALVMPDQAAVVHIL